MRPPLTATAAALATFLDVVVDHLARASTAEPAIKRKEAKPVFDSVHDRWLHALHTGDGALRGDRSEVERLAESIRSWRAWRDTARPLARLRRRFAETTRAGRRAWHTAVPAGLAATARCRAWT